MIRWGFLGAGYVASRAMAPAVHEAQGAILQAVASRDAQRSAALEPQTVSATYDVLLNDPEIDAVYISLTNAQHYHWVLAALRAGKHVLCEKPLGVNASDVSAMQAEAEGRGLLLVEAAWVRWHPRFQRFLEIVSSGILGPISTIDSAFTFQHADPNNYRWFPEWGGGALLDVGCYQAHVWSALTDDGDDVVVNSVERVVDSHGVDATTIARAHIGRSIEARMECSFVAAPVQRLSVANADHHLAMGRGEAFTSWREPTSLTIDGRVETFPAVDAFVIMVEQVSARIRGEESWIVPLEDSLSVARILDLIAAHRVA